mmetsp:Transcript_9610/g.17455  ORF Transcript_9610/g.17455 Transcript_9610/m.17455 type:complete len:222 (-) Transcript_9610:694-1359(-)
MLVRRVEARPDQPPQAPDDREQEELPDGEVDLPVAQARELPEAEELLGASLPPPGVQILHAIKCQERHHTAEENPPSQLRTPVARPLLQREQHPPYRRRERRAHPCRRPAGDEVALLLVVAEGVDLGEGGVDAADLGLALGDGGGDYSSAVHHRAFLPHRQPRSDRERDPQNLTEKRLYPNDPREGYPVEEALHLGYTRPSRYGFKVHHKASYGNVECLVE